MRPIPEPKQPLQRRDLRGCRLFIATPCYGGIGSVYSESVHKLAQLLDKLGIEWILARPNGEMVARARNRLVEDARAREATHLIQIDSDIEFNPADVVAMMQCNVHVLGGLYPLKGIDWAKVRAAARAGVGAEWIGEAGLSYCFNAVANPRSLRGAIEVATVGTGFLLVHMSTIERMRKAYPELEYDDDFSDTRNRKTFALFDYGVENRRYLSEDWRFCQRWRAIGGVVWAWPHAPLAHEGRFSYGGDFRRRIKEKCGGRGSVRAAAANQTPTKGLAHAM